MIIAQITDIHLRLDHRPLGGTDTVAALDAAVAHVNRLDPPADVVLATGDLTDDGGLEDFALLRRSLDRIRAPVYVIPGNHDDREGLRAAFADRGYLPVDGAFLHYVIEDHPVRLIGLDTVIAGEASGRMCPDRLGWLAARLAEAPTRPTLVFMHHPPFRVGIGFMEPVPFDGADALAGIVRAHPQVEHVVCGHSHRPVHVRWAGTVASVAPSAARQVVLSLSDHTPAALAADPPACAVYRWIPGTGIIGHVSLIEDAGSKVS